MGGACSTYGERRGVYRVMVGKPKGKDHWEEPGADGRIIKRWVLRNGIWGYGLDRAGSG